MTSKQPTCVNSEKPRSERRFEGRRVLKPSKLRPLAKGAIALIVAIGIAVGGGVGAYSALGIDSISALCPLGALEALAGGWAFVPRVLIALTVVVLLVLLVGRAWCAWICPVPPLDRLLSSKKRRREQARQRDAAGKLAYTRWQSCRNACAACANACKPMPKPPAEGHAAPVLVSVASPSAEAVGTSYVMSNDPDCCALNVGNGVCVSAADVTPEAFIADCAAPATASATPSGETAAKLVGQDAGIDDTHVLGISGDAAVSAACASAKSPAEGGAPVPANPTRPGAFKLDSRHAVLAGALGSAAIFGFPVFCLVCPIGLTVATAVLLVRLVGYNEPSWGLIVFPLIIAAELIFARSFCGKLCPVAALMSLLGRANRTLRPRVDEAKCLRESASEPCHACASVCPVGIDPHSDLGMLPKSECTRCGRCAEVCPVGAVGFRSPGTVRIGQKASMRSSR